MHLKIKTESKDALFFLPHNSNKSQEQAEKTKDLFLSGSLGGWLTASNELFAYCSWQRWANSPLSPDMSHVTADRKRELGFFLQVLSIKHNANDSWGQQSLKLRLCRAAKNQVRRKQVQKIPAFSYPTAALNCSMLSLSQDSSLQNSECLWILSHLPTSSQKNIWCVFLYFSKRSSSSSS